MMLKMKLLMLWIIFILCAGLVTSGANDPMRFGNLTETTVLVGGAKGIIWTNTTNVLYVNSSLGRVGIGTATPSAKLEILQASAAVGLDVTGTVDSTSSWAGTFADESIGTSKNQVQLARGGDTGRNTALFTRNLGADRQNSPMISITQANETDDQAATKISQSGLNNGLWVYSNVADTVTSPLVFIEADNAAFDQSGLKIQMDGTGLAIEAGGLVKATEFQGTINWSYNTNYPSACPANSYITQLDDSITCTAVSNISNNVTIGEVLFVDYLEGAGGNVGIGTAIPISVLTVDSGDAAESVALHGGVTITGQRNGGVGNLVLRHEGESGTATDANQGAQIYFQGWNSTDYMSGVVMFAKASEHFDAGGGSGMDLIFYTAETGSSTTTERMSIKNNGVLDVSGLITASGINTTTGSNFATSSGNVGIGTTSPNAKLHVVGTTNITGIQYAGSNVTRVAANGNEGCCGMNEDYTYTCAVGACS